MDAEALRAGEGWAKLEAMRDEALAEASRLEDALRARLAEMESMGNRHERRKARLAGPRIDAFASWYRKKMAAEFERWTRGFDPDVGTLKAVQDEARAKLAAIFG